MNPLGPGLASLVVTVQGLAGERAAELIAGLAEAHRPAALACCASTAALTRAERHGRIAALGVRAPDGGLLARRLARLPPGLRAAVERELPFPQRARGVRAALPLAAETTSAWGARLALEWTALRPHSARTPSSRRDVPPAAVPAIPAGPVPEHGRATWSRPCNA